MDGEQFREAGKKLIDYIADYFENIEQRRVNPDVQPGFLLNELPLSAPEHGEDFSNIFEDYERHVMPGIAQFNSPHHHALFPSGCSYPSILGELLAAATGGVGFSWVVNPSYTELEIVTLECLGKMLGLPKEFLAMTPPQGSEGKRGGGVIQGSGTESILVAMLAARKAALDRLKKKCPDELESVLMDKLVAYSSQMAHSSVEKAKLVCATKLRLIETDDQGVIDTDSLTKAIEADVNNGLVPFYCCGNLGTTSVCSFDNLEELGPICKQWNMWLHIDAAYAGTFFVCPEYRTYLKGIEFADSFNFNCHKMMLTNFDCSPLWVKNRDALMDTFSVDRSYFKNDNSESIESAGNNKSKFIPTRGGVVTDFRKWQIPLGRRFRALKLWFVLRSYGIEGLQRHVREHLQRAKLFESLVAQDPRFEFWPRKPNLGLVCFRLKGSVELTKQLADNINKEGKIAVSDVLFKDKTTIRFHGGSRTKEHNIHEAWDVIRKETDKLQHHINSLKI